MCVHLMWAYIHIDTTHCLRPGFWMIRWKLVTKLATRGNFQVYVDSGLYVSKLKNQCITGLKKDHIFLKNVSLNLKNANRIDLYYNLIIVCLLAVLG